MYLRLSYDLSMETPMPVGLPPVVIRQRDSILKGNVSNLSLLEFCSHCGTHCDAPWHFNQLGRRLTDFPIEFFFFNAPLVIETPKGDSGLVTAQDLEPHSALLAACDLLLLRTGYSVHRSNDQERYIFKNPGLSVGAAEYLQTGFPNIRAVGIDTISVAANEHLSEGLEVHRVLFRDLDAPKILLEDLNLAFDLERLNKVIVLPIFLARIDGAPCTIVGETEGS